MGILKQKFPEKNMLFQLYDGYEIPARQRGHHALAEPSTLNVGDVEGRNLWRVLLMRLGGRGAELGTGGIEPTDF